MNKLFIFQFKYIFPTGILCRYLSGHISMEKGPILQNLNLSFPVFLVLVEMTVFRVRSFQLSQA
jgi:hypothetical protein